MTRRFCVLFLVLSFLSVPAMVAQEAAKPVVAGQEQILLNLEQRTWWENYLRTAKVIKTKGINVGVTGPRRMTLSDGKVTHDAAFKTIDEFKRGLTQLQTGTHIDFKDSYKFDLAAYELDRMLEINMIPPTVGRVINQQRGSLSLWVDDAQMEKDRIANKVQPPDPRRWNNQMHIVRLFDGLIYNWDRNLGNLLITQDWKLWMIDHGRAFKTLPVIFNEKDIVRVPRDLWKRMQALEYSTLHERLKDHLSEFEIKAILKRRDLLTAHIEKLAAEKGEGVFY